ncbi:hypothetical protein pb186bvf_013684 [Paramecium bursaria]
MHYFYNYLIRNKNTMITHQINFEQIVFSHQKFKNNLIIFSVFIYHKTTLIQQIYANGFLNLLRLLNFIYVHYFFKKQEIIQNNQKSNNLYSIQYSNLDLSNNNKKQWSLQLEDKYQNYSQRLFENSLNDYFTVQNIGLGFMALNWILRYNLLPAILTTLCWIFNIIINTLFRRQEWAKPYMPMYLILMSMAWSSYQLLLLRIDLFQASYDDNLVALDVIQQFSNLFIIGQNHIASSLLYFYFVIIRIYVQSERGFSYISITFLVFSYFYVINQYRQTEAQRQMFLKTLRNSCFDHLIDSFIDQNVIVIQKDESNITFKEINKSKSMQVLCDQNIKQLLKLMIVPQYKTNLETYLYNTQQQNEKLICCLQGDIFKVTYEFVVFQKVEFFIKFTQIVIDKVCKLDYKYLYNYQKQCITKLLNNNQLSQQIDRKLQWKSLLFCFKHFYYGYHPVINQISYQQFLFESNLINVQTNVDMEYLKTDIILLKMLFKILQSIINYFKVQIYIQQDTISFKILGSRKQKKSKYEYLIDRILFHIGIGRLKVEEENDYIQVSFQILSDLDEKYVK